MLRGTRATTSIAQRTQAASLQTRHGRRFPIKLRYVAVIVLLTIAAYHYFAVQRAALSQLHQKQAQLNKQLVQLRTQQSTLTKEQKQLNDNAYIARYASEHYHLILPGQVPFDISH